MEKLSITQEYLLCSLTDKGVLPSFQTEIQVCLVAGGLLELWLAGCVAIADKKVLVQSELPAEKVYLRSMYDYISEKPRPLKKVAEEYNFAFSNKKLNQLIDDTGKTLVASCSATPEKGGLFSSKSCYIPDKNEVDRIVQRIRAQFLGDEALSEEAIALVSLLEKGKQLKRYFSGDERKILKKRMEEIKESPSHKVIKEMVDYINELFILMCVIPQINS